MSDLQTNESEVRQAPSIGSENTPPVPNLMQMLGNLLGSMNTPSEATSAPATESQTTLPADGLSSILSNPAVLAKLPEVMAMLKPITEAAAQTAPVSANSTPTAATPVSTDRDRLLLSLKPFLSSQRCEAIDTMLRIAKLGALFQQLK